MEMKEWLLFTCVYFELLPPLLFGTSYEHGLNDVMGWGLDM
jgi:hypothetical protein